MARVKRNNTRKIEYPNIPNKRQKIKASEKEDVSTTENNTTANTTANTPELDQNGVAVDKEVHTAIDNKTSKMHSTVQASKLTSEPENEVNDTSKTDTKSSETAFNTQAVDTDITETTKTDITKANSDDIIEDHVTEPTAEVVEAIIAAKAVSEDSIGDIPDTTTQEMNSQLTMMAAVVAEAVQTIEKVHNKSILVGSDDETEKSGIEESTPELQEPPKKSPSKSPSPKPQETPKKLPHKESKAIKITKGKKDILVTSELPKPYRLKKLPKKSKSFPVEKAARKQSLFDPDDKDKEKESQSRMALSPAPIPQNATKKQSLFDLDDEDKEKEPQSRIESSPAPIPKKDTKEQSLFHLDDAEKESETPTRIASSPAPPSNPVEELIETQKDKNVTITTQKDADVTTIEIQKDADTSTALPTKKDADVSAIVPTQKDADTTTKDADMTTVDAEPKEADVTQSIEPEENDSTANFTQSDNRIEKATKKHSLFESDDEREREKEREHSGIASSPAKQSSPSRRSQCLQSELNISHAEILVNKIDENNTQENTEWNDEGTPIIPVPSDADDDDGEGGEDSDAEKNDNEENFEEAAAEPNKTHPILEDKANSYEQFEADMRLETNKMYYQEKPRTSTKPKRDFKKVSALFPRRRIHQLSNILESTESQYSEEFDEFRKNAEASQELAERLINQLMQRNAYLETKFQGYKDQVAALKDENRTLQKDLSVETTRWKNLMETSKTREQELEAEVLLLQANTIADPATLKRVEQSTSKLNFLELLSGVKCSKMVNDPYLITFFIRQASKTGDLYYKLTLVKGDKDGEQEVIYEPQWTKPRRYKGDWKENVKKVKEALPDYLHEELTFPSHTMQMFYSKINISLNSTKSSSDDEEEEEEEEENGDKDVVLVDATPAEIPDAEIPDAEIPDAEIPDAEIPDAEIPQDANPDDFIDDDLIQAVAIASGVTIADNVEHVNPADL